MRCTSKSYGSVQKEGNQRKLERTILLITSIYLRKSHNDQQYMKHNHVESHVKSTLSFTIILMHAVAELVNYCRMKEYIS